MITTQKNFTGTVYLTGFYVLLTAGGLLLLLPVIWMVLASFMTRSDVLATPVNLIPPVWQPQNYGEIFTDFNLGRY